MRRLALAILAILILLPLANAQELNALSAPSEIVKGDKLEVYVSFKNTLNDTVRLKKIRIEIVGSNGELLNSSEQSFLLPVNPNATAVVYGYMVVDLQPGAYKYNVIVYYKQGDETKSKTVINQHDLLVKGSSNPRVALVLTIVLFGSTLGFLMRIGSRGLHR